MAKVKAKSLTPEELARFDGREGRPQYLAYKGKVYDLSGSHLWKNGLHLGGAHSLGENLEEALKQAPHGEEVLSRFPIIGDLKPPLIPILAMPASPPGASNPPKKAAGEWPKETRRDFLKVILTAGGVATVLAVTSSLKALSAIPQSSVQRSWPRLKATNIDSIQLLTPITFAYPLTNTPNILVKLGISADNGVGPEGDIVAFSGICQHLGCYYGFIQPGSSPHCNPSFKATIAEGYCCCHGSQYDFVHAAAVIHGPAPSPLPQVTLEYDDSTGDVYAVGMGSPTIFGHGPPGTTDPNLVLQYDLQGGTVVTS